MFLLYIALILSRIDNGCQVFMSVPKCISKHDHIQSMAWRICTVTFATTPVSVLQVECAEMPLGLCRELVSQIFSQTEI